MKKQSGSFFSWLGRQVGHVRQAIRTPAQAEPKVVYRKESVQEAQVEGQQGRLLRRTVVDEVIEGGGEGAEEKQQGG